MSLAKSLSVGLVIWATLGTLVRADSMSSATWDEDWTVFNPVKTTDTASSYLTATATYNPTIISNSTMMAAPAPAAVPEPQAAPAPEPQAAPAVAPTSTTGPIHDAFVNMGTGPYPDASGLANGGAQPWYNSQPIVNLFGGTPSASQQASFENTVLQRVEQTFQLAGVPVNLTDNPNDAAAHTLSVVSHAASTMDGKDIGLTYVGGNGFSFIDQEAKSAGSVDQLAWIVAHNVAHELMLAFGVPENYDQSGKFIDSKIAPPGMILDPKATFSPEAAKALLAQNFQINNDPAGIPGQQLVGVQPVPEPATLLAWSVGATAALAGWRRRVAAR